MEKCPEERNDFFELFKMVSGKVIQFRRGRHIQKPRHFLIEIPGTDSREKAMKFAGQSVIWKSEGKNVKEIKGKISSAHGNKGVVRAIFEKGLPGQAIGTDVEISGGKVESSKTKKVEDKE